MFSKFEKRKIAVLNSFTAANIKNDLFIEGIKTGIYSEIDFGGYDQYLFELLNKESFIYKNKYDFILLLIDSNSVLNLEFDFIDRKKEDILSLIEEKIIHLNHALTFAKENTPAVIFVSNLIVPPSSPLGLHETKADLGYFEAIRIYNDKLKEMLKKENQFYLFDIDSIMSAIGKDHMTNYKYYYLGKILLHEKAASKVAKEAIAGFGSCIGKTKKCLVVDLDNTLWGGVVGEAGAHGIILGDEGVGLAYKTVQKIILNLFKRGIIIAVVSKNNPEDAISPFKENKNMVLKEKNIAVFKANWKDKATNIVDVANELNIGLDSMVFLDDNPAERGLVKQMIPQIEVIDFPEDISELPELLRKLKSFDKIFMTEEDKTKGEMYAQDSQRKNFKINFKDEKDYLKELEIGMEIEKADETNIQRITELINKTNQFNLRTKRTTIAEIESAIKNHEYNIFCCRAKDKFGEQGIVGVIVLKYEKEHWFIENYLLS
jgi:FkbH-like protein